jgi:hypothetical protein
MIRCYDNWELWWLDGLFGLLDSRGVSSLVARSNPPLCRRRTRAASSSKGNSRSTRASSGVNRRGSGNGSCAMGGIYRQKTVYPARWGERKESPPQSLSGEAVRGLSAAAAARSPAQWGNEKLLEKRSNHVTLYGSGTTMAVLFNTVGGLIGMAAAGIPTRRGEHIIHVAWVVLVRSLYFSKSLIQYSYSGLGQVVILL